MMRDRLTKAAIAAASLALLPLSAQAETPGIVATIAPLHSIAAAVTEGVSEPSLLVPADVSPHAYSMRPSDAQALQDSTMVLWIGEGLETFLVGRLETMAPRAEIIDVTEINGLRLMTFDEEHAHDHGEHRHGEHRHEEHAHGEDGHKEHAHADHGHADQGHKDHDHGDHGHGDHAHGDHSHDHHGHSHAAGSLDPHLWLDPENAWVIGNELSERLAAADPAHADIYRRNATAFEATLKALDAELRDELAAVQDQGYVVYHAAYRYFEERYGLNPVGVVTQQPEAGTSAGELARLREDIRARGASCVFSEPQFDPRTVARLVGDTGLRQSVLDPLGAKLEPGPDLYPALLRNLSNSITGCLTPSS